MNHMMNEEKINSIKAVFFDIDGTLYRHEDDFYAPSSIKAIKQLQKQGIKVIVCTGRSLHEYYSLPDVFSKHPFDGLITSAGSHVSVSATTLKADLFEPDQIEEILSRCEEHGLNIYFMDDENVGLWKEPDEFVIQALTEYRQEIPKVIPLNKQCVHHMIAFGTKEIDETLKAQLPFLTYHRSGARAIDLYPAKVDKSAGIDSICKHFGISPAECMAFGDSFNDVEMLRHVGIGVAMGNGSELAKAAADVICESMNDDGVYLTCQRFGLIQEEV